MRVAVIADIGRQPFHVGDEAIGQAAADALRHRGLEPVLISHDPETTRSMYADVDVVPAIEIPDSWRKRSELLARASAVEPSDARQPQGADPVGADQADSLRAGLTLLATVDALLVAGGGNLSSAYGPLLYERLVMLRLAQRLGLATVVSGQSLGPELIGPDRQAVAEVLRDCRLVGLRDARSVRLGRSLVPDGPIVQCLDDASFLGVEPADGGSVNGGSADTSGTAASTGPAATESGHRASGPLVTATFNAWMGPTELDAVADLLAGELDAFVAEHDARVVLVPHQASLDTIDFDAEVHAKIAQRATADVTCLPAELPLRSAAQSAAADLVVTSRFHPAVFALARAVPTVALPVDDYGDMRLNGLFTQWGLAGWPVPFTVMRPGDLHRAMNVTLEHQGALRTHLQSTGRTLHAGQDEWWDRLVAALTSPAAPGPGLESGRPVADRPLADRPIPERPAPTDLARWRTGGRMALNASRIRIEGELQRQLITDESAYLSEQIELGRQNQEDLAHNIEAGRHYQEQLVAEIADLQQRLQAAEAAKAFQEALQAQLTSTRAQLELSVQDAAAARTALLRETRATNRRLRDLTRSLAGAPSASPPVSTGLGKVVGVGWAKTGTTTLGDCLTLLGFDHQSQDFDLVDDLGRGDLTAIMATIARRDSFDDWPWLLLYREIDRQYPGSKFVLTVRDEGQWLASYQNMLRGQGDATPEMNSARRTLYGLPFPDVTEEQLLERYRRHNADVTHYFADRPGDLLVVDWSAGDGWQRLCDFLGRPVPDADFPWSNRGAYQGSEST